MLLLGWRESMLVGSRGSLAAYLPGSIMLRPNRASIRSLTDRTGCLESLIIVAAAANKLSHNYPEIEYQKPQQ